MTASDEAFFSAFTNYMKSGESQGLNAFLAEQDTGSVSRLAIYRNGFYKAAIGALESNFPSLKMVLPAEYLFYLSKRYIDRHPPISASLVGYGMKMEQESTHGFLDFLQHEEGIDVPAAFVNLAQLDQVWLQTLNAAQEKVLTGEDVQSMITAGVDLATSSISLINSSQLVLLDHPVFELWQGMRFGTDQQNVLSSLENLPAQSVCILFWQQHGQVQAKALSQVEKCFLETLQETQSLIEAERAARYFGDKNCNKADEESESFDLSVFFAELLNAALIRKGHI